MAATTSINEWNFREKHVQAELTGGRFVNASSVLFAAGPPQIRFAGNASTDFNEENVATRGELNAVARPLGVLENVAIGQNRQLQQLFEIGSKRSYFIPGRTISQLNFARVLYSGPNLLRTLFAWYPATKIGPTVAQLLAAGAGRAGKGAPTIEYNPGFADFFMVLDSDLFDQPFGLLMIIHDNNDDPYGAMYMELAYIQAHQFTVNSTATVVAEGATARFDKMLAVDVGAVARSLELTKLLEERDVTG